MDFRKCLLRDDRLIPFRMTGVFLSLSLSLPDSCSRSEAVNIQKAPKSVDCSI